MRPLLKYSLVLLFSTLLIIGCGTKSRNNQSDSITHKEVSLGDCTESSLWISDQLLQVASSAEHRIASSEISLGDTQLSTRIDLFIDRDQGIMLSARPLPIVEALRIYLLPDHISLYDMIHNGVVTISYYELSEHLGTAISYSLLRDLVLGEPSYLKDHEYARLGRLLQASLDTDSGQRWVINYMVNSECQLGSISISPADQSGSTTLQADYSYQDGAKRPTVVELLIMTPQRHLSMRLSYNNTKELTASQLQKRITEPLDGYTTLNLEELLRVL